MITPKKAASDSLGEALASLVDDLIAKEPFKADGFDWAAQPQSFYCEKLNTSPATLRRRIAKPPFVRAWKMVGAEITTDGEDTNVVGGKKLCLLRTGEAPPKDIADEAKRVMIKIWNGKMAKPVKQHEGRCLWGMAGDMMKLLAAFDLPAELGGELAIAVFKLALADWQQVASGIKLAMHIQPNCTPKFYAYPSITVIRRFWKAAVYAFIQAAQSGDVKVPAGLEMLATPASWKLLDATDPLKVTPAKQPVEAAA